MDLKIVEEMIHEEAAYRKYEIGNYVLEETMHKDLKPLYRVEYKDYKKANESHQPAIHFHNDIFGKGKSEFLIQTTSRGTLGIDEIEMMIVAYKEAVEVVKVLNGFMEQQEA